jgi:hypothetical protein
VPNQASQFHLEPHAFLILDMASMDLSIQNEEAAMNVPALFSNNTSNLLETAEHLALGGQICESSMLP